MLISARSFCSFCSATQGMLGSVFICIEISMLYFSAWHLPPRSGAFDEGVWRRRARDAGVLLFSSIMCLG
jgi:hypothetical protein